MAPVCVSSRPRPFLWHSYSAKRGPTRTRSAHIQTKVPRAHLNLPSSPVASAWRWSVPAGQPPFRVIPKTALSPLPPIRNSPPSALREIAENIAEVPPAAGLEVSRDYDVFISHATEDKDSGANFRRGEQTVSRGGAAPSAGQGGVPAVFGAGERFNPCKAFPTTKGCGEVTHSAIQRFGADAYVSVAGGRL